MEKEREQLKQGVIEEEMKTAYVDYAMSVIVGRALPDARDGLKPVQRRILWAMKGLGLTYSGSHKKSARIVGETMGKYHPHGDSAVYDALVRMGQDFSLRYPLIDPQGNFGSIDGDPAAAQRYTEAKMAKISNEMLADIDKETVPFTDNFDGTLQEPLVLPSKIPNLLANGSSGIAVGMTTNIPPHNLKEVCKACTALIDNPSLDNVELMEYIKGPDFPTGGVIAGRNGIVQAYKTGRGKVKVRGKIHEEDDGDKLIVTELPYMVNKAKLIKKIADKVKNDKIEGIRDLRDESDREGMRVVIELKRGANPDVVKNTLFKHTRLSDTLSMIHIALVDDEPVKLTLKQLLKQHINHRREVVINRTEYDLQKAQDRSHILEGLIVALDNVDDVIELIRSAEDASDAKEELMEEYDLSEEQGKAILDMRLQRLASMEQQKIKDEHADLKEDIKEYKSILNSEERVNEILKEEYKEVAEKYGDERQTAIQENYQELETEDLIPEEDMVITLSNDGYTKRMSLDTYRSQHRGGKGIIGAKTKEDDFVQNVFVANTHSYLLFFTDTGQVYWKKVYKIPEGSRTARGTPIVNILDMDKEEKIKAVIPVSEFDDEHYLLTASRNGKVKKTNLEAYSRPRRGGIIALGLEEGDELVNVKMTDDEQEVILATQNGMAIRFNESDVRSMGRTAKGVKGCDLRGKDKVVDMVTTTDPSKKLLTITENGYGKKTPISKYRLINRGGKGVINIKTNDRNGKVVTTKVVNDEEDLICISKNGIVLRTKSEEISTMGRNTQGVRIMRLDEKDKVMSAAKVLEQKESEESAEE